MGKLAVFTVATAFTVAYDGLLAWLVITGDVDAAFGLFLLAAVIGFFLLILWLAPLAKGKLEPTFFDHAAFVLLCIHTIGVFIWGIMWSPRPDNSLYGAFLSILFVAPVPVAFMLVLGLLLGRDRFEKSVYVGYLPPSRREPEPPKLHVEIERRRYTIERGKGRN